MKQYNRRLWFQWGIASIFEGIVTLVTLGHYTTDYYDEVLMKRANWDTSEGDKAYELLEKIGKK